ncbi:hypothetical protein FQN60_006425 [Etheostoma spectabile]|uniref:Uncharacterized protein n=1 Tax=Etheostoma spectabile TaxID=54343 RepID=A0A5J5CMB6_9PERO|nr:hypothetical protein FQN60_006425 [Etheostoma spectabile]
MNVCRTSQWDKTSQNFRMNSLQTSPVGQRRLREGRLRLHVCRLRLKTGLYKCQFFTDFGRSSGKCWLNVQGKLKNLIAARDA